jgi:tetratricopeptide (TPR) repeat protein
MINIRLAWAVAWLVPTESPGWLEAQVPALDSVAAVGARADTLSSSRDPTRRRQSVVLRFEAAARYEKLGDRTNAAIQLKRAGEGYRGIGHTDSALVAFGRGLALVSAGDAVAAELLLRTGEAYDYLSQKDSARTYVERAIAAARAGGLRRIEGAGLRSLGGFWLDQGRIDSAAPLIHAAMDIARGVGDRLDEAEAANTLGFAFRRLSVFDSAETYYERALRIVREARDTRGEGYILNNLGSVLWAVGRLDTALTVYRGALEIHRSNGESRGEAQTLNNIATILDAAGRHDSALIAYRESLRIRREVGDRPGISNVLNNIGYGFIVLGQLDSALVYLTESLGIWRATGNRPEEARVLSNLGFLYDRRGQSDSAARYQHQALSIRREVGDRFGIGQSLALLGRAYRNFPRAPGPFRAAAYFDSAAATFSEISVRAGNDPNRVSLGESLVDLYRLWTLATLAQAPTMGAQAAALAALAVTDRGRAQALLDLMRAGERSALAPGGDLTREGERLVADLRATGIAAVVYFATTDTLLSFVVSPSRGLKVIRRAVSLDSLERWVQEFRLALNVEDGAIRLAVRGESIESVPSASGGSAPRRRWEESGSRLTTLLLPDELGAELGDAREVLLIPQGPLALVPFAALPTGKGTETLGDRFAIRYGPSLATVAQVEQRPRLAPGAGGFRTAVVVGNPPMPEVAMASGGRSALTPLPGAAAEGREVARRLTTPLRTGADATEPAIRGLLPEAPVIHLATHAFTYSGSERARDSFIALGPSAGADGRLTVGEILDDPALNLRADLVVLSACQTGLGNLRQAEGTVGLQRAFLAKGARSLLVSLWNVSDVATEKLMVGFYRHWLDDSDRPGKALALRRAQQDVRGLPGFEHPRYWAGFQLVGAR